MGITHVIRGEDLIDTTHRVLALRARARAPTAPMPQYAHLPADRRGRSRAKLSKRHGAVAVEDFVDRGYLPEALTNYLALLGLGTGRRPEVLDARRARRRSSTSTGSRTSAAVFDREEARLAQRRVDPSARSLDDLVARVDPDGRRRASATDIDVDVVAAAVAIAAGARVDARRSSSTRWRSSFGRRRLRDRRRPVGRTCESTDRIAEVLDAVDRARRRRVEWTPRRRRAPAGRSTRSASSREGHEAAVHRVEGAPAGPAAVRLDASCSAVNAPSADSGVPGPPGVSDRLA